MLGSPEYLEGKLDFLDEEDQFDFFMEKVDYTYILLACNLMKYTIFNQLTFAI